mgnify:CR=1 FL=1
MGILLCKLQPFYNYKNDQVTKYTGHKDQLWDELKVDVHWLTEKPENKNQLYINMEFNT